MEILSTLKSAIFVGLLSFASLFGDMNAYVQEKIDSMLGAQNAVAGEVYFASGSGFSATQTTIDLTKFGYTKPDGTYQKFNMGNFGDLGCVTADPAVVKKQEFISFTGITQNSDGTAQLTGVTRGLERFPPYSASSTLRTNHVGGSKLVVSNSPPCFYEGFANRTASTTITARWIYDIYPEISGTVNATTSRQLATKGYADALTNQGAATSTETLGGIVELATLTEQASSTDLGANIPLVLQAKNSTSTCQVAGTYNIVANNTGKLDANCIPNAIGVGTTTPSVGLSVGATTTTANLTVSSSTISVNGVTMLFPSTQGAASTTLKNNGSGSLIWELPDVIELADSTLGSASSTWSIIVPNRKMYEIHVIADNTTGAIWGLAYNGKVATGDWGTRFSINGLADTFTTTNNYCQLVSGTNFGAINVDATFNNASSTLKNFTFQTSTSTVSFAPGRSEGACTHRTAEPVTSIDVFVSAGSINTGSRVIIYGSRN